MRSFGFVGVAAVALLALPLQAQLEGNTRVAKVFAKGYQSPICSLKGDFRTGSAGTYLKSASEMSDPERRLGMIEKAKEAALSGLEVNPEIQAGWYYLGLVELYLGNLTGADTAFTAAAKFAPDCAEEIKGLRQRAWTQLLMGASDFMQKSQNDSALALFREAAVISREYPQGFYNTGVLFANMQMPDSAAQYFKLAIDKSGKDPRFAKDRLSALVNYASMLQAMDKHAEAVEQFRLYLAADPSDVQVKRAMASSLRLSGHPDEAAKIEDAMLNAAIADGTASANDLMQLGVNHFQAERFAEAADAFQKVLAKQPQNRDAIFNLANVYLAQKEGAKLVEYGLLLVAREPLATINLKMLAEGYRIAGNQDKLISTVEKLVAMPTNLTVDLFSMVKGGAKVSGTATGLEATTPGGSPLPPAAKTVVVEFINDAGAVIATKEVTIPALKAGESQAFEAEGTGEGITGWRYTVK